MADWCDNCEGEYPNYYCKATGKKISWGVVENHCMKDGLGCSDCYVSTAVRGILKKDVNDKAFEGIRTLRKRLEDNETYANFIEMYDHIGDTLAEKIKSDEESVELSEKLYSIMNRVSIFVEKGKDDRATYYYGNMVGVLVNRYGLNKLYEAEASFINRENPESKKVPKLTKKY